MSSFLSIRRPHRRLFVRLAWLSYLSVTLSTTIVAEQTDVSSSARGVTQIIAHRGASAERPECTVAAIQRAMAVGATAVEVDVRMTENGDLFILHDATLDRTTNGKGLASKLSLSHLQQLDAGSWFSPRYKGERIPTLEQAASLCSDKVDVLLDLKEQGQDYDRRVVDVIKRHGNPSRTIVGVRSVEQAIRFRKLLPDARQLGLIPNVDDIESFANAGVETIRLWPRWLKDDTTAVDRIRAAGKNLHLNGTLGEREETKQLLKFKPDSLSSDHPERLIRTLHSIAHVDDTSMRDPGASRAHQNSAIATELFDKMAKRSTNSKSSRRLDRPQRSVGFGIDSFVTFPHEAR